MSSVKNISISYDPINEQNTFTNGDIISGRVILELSKDTEINSLSVKAKGKAEVHWTERHNDRTETYHAKEKYFTLEQFILQKRKEDGHKSMLVDQCGETYSKEVPAGKHVYPFSFQIPQGNMPSSFKGVHGKVIYTLEAKLDRSMRFDSKAQAVIHFVSKADLNNPHIMSPQAGTQTKKMKLFTSGNAAMNIKTDRMGYMQGEGITITADIENSSSRDLIPKFAIEQKIKFYARGKSRIYPKKIIKEEAQAVPASTRQTVTKVLKVPQDLPPSITNCNIIKMEYKLKVYLDVPYASDPEVKFPLIILPAGCLFGQTGQPGTSMGFPSYGNPNQGGPIYTNQPPAFPGVYPPPTVPGGYPHPSGPGGYPPPPGPVGYPPQAMPGPYQPQSVPSGPPPPYASLPQPGPGADLPQTAPSAPPPPYAPGTFVPQAAPSAPPPPYAPGAYVPQTAPNAPPPQVPPGMYPTLPDFEKKA